MNFLRKYNVTLDLTTAGSQRIRIPIRKAGVNDFAVGADWTPASGDVKVSKDGGAQANIGTLPTYSNGSWEFTLTGTELSARCTEVRIVDSATKAVDDEGFNIETFGHASAMFAADYIDVVRNGLTSIPSSTQFLKIIKHLDGVLEGLATSGGTTTTVPCNVTTGINGGVPSATNDFYNGAMLVWITGALAGQRTVVSDYNGTTKVLTVTAMTGAPSSGDTFILI